MSDFHWDIFLSHASADKPRVARLAERLEAAGQRVCLIARASTVVRTLPPRLSVGWRAPECSSCA
jgi:hypothetical protein